MSTNLSNSTPAAPGGNTNVTWQADGSGNVSGYVPSVGSLGGVLIKTASYNPGSADNQKLITVEDASPHTAVTITLPNPTPASPWEIALQNSSSFSITLSPNGLNLDGVSASLTIPVAAGVLIFTDGTNYFTERGLGSGGTVTAVTGSAPISSSGGATPNITVAAATSGALGVVQPDGTIITVSAGAITVPKASSSVFGVVEVDGTTITAAGGVISAAGGGSYVGPTSQTILTSPTRQLGTTYHNTSSTARYVIVTTCSAAGALGGYVDSFSPPTDQITQTGTDSGNCAEMVLIVPPGYYYLVKAVVSSPTVAVWVEYN